MTIQQTEFAVLTEEQCWDLLETRAIGRLALINGRQPDIFPVNYVAHERQIYIRTAPGTKLAAAVLSGRVAFEIDELDHALHAGWSVVVHGKAKELERLEDIMQAEELGVEPWEHSPKNHFVVITPEQVTGRALDRRDQVTPEPEEPPTAAQADIASVVLPLDGSPTSARALPAAKALADRLGVPLSVLSIVEDMRSDAVDRMSDLYPVIADLPEEVERAIVQADTIGSAIAEQSAGSLICMATSAELFMQDRLVGSIAELVIAAATSPAVIIGPNCDPEADIDRIVVGIDPSHQQTGLVLWATRLGYLLDSPVDFVHVDHGDGTPLGPRVRRLHLEKDEKIADRLVAEADRAMLAIGSHGRRGLLRLAEGSVGGDIFRAATRPVLVLGPNIAT